MTNEVNSILMKTGHVKKNYVTEMAKPS